MRGLKPDAELGDTPLPLRQELTDCLARWRESGVELSPDDDLIILLEVGDGVGDLARYLGDDIDHVDDFYPPAEWVADRGCCLEMFLCYSDAGNGLSVILPRTDEIDPQLLALFTSYNS